MEGFDPTKVNEILNLEEQNLTSILLCPIGYRHAEDSAQYENKVRKSQKDLFDIIK
jgi:nitroreductase